jgi:type IV pilus assembly protein PilE
MNNKGFTLIESLIVLAIIGILASLAYPSYQNYIIHARRSDGQTALLDLSARLEQYYAQQQTYQTATMNTGTPTDISGTNLSPQGWYTLSIAFQDTSAYTIQASPIHSQAFSDTLCQTFTLNHLGVKGITAGPAGAPKGLVRECWQ